MYTIPESLRLGFGLTEGEMTAGIGGCSGCDLLLMWCREYTKPGTAAAPGISEGNEQWSKSPSPHNTFCYSRSWNILKTLAIINAVFDKPSSLTAVGSVHHRE